MKPFWGIDLTQNKKNEQVNGEEFLVQKPSSALTQSLETSTEKAVSTLINSKLPLPLRIVQWLCGLLCVIIISSIFSALVHEDGVSLSQAYQNAPFLFWLGGSCLVIWLPLKLYSLHKEKDVLETDESTLTFEHLENACAAIFSELDIPADAIDVDILSFFYKIKDDKVKVCEKGMQIAPYMNTPFRVFKDSENIYFANMQGKYAFPLASIKSIKTIKKSICMDDWNKNESYDKGIYKQYKLGETNLGSITCKYYHIIELEYNGETWAIYTPCYELSVFEQLTGLKAQEE